MLCNQCDYIQGKNEYFCFDRTTSSRKKRPEPEPENEDIADDNKENKPVEKKPKIHELPPAKPSTKQSKRAQDHEMTKELLSSILAKNEDDKVDMLMGFIAKHIQKNLPDEEAEECTQEITDVINRYIMVAKRRINPTATPAASPAPAQSPGPAPAITGPSGANFLPPMPPLMQMNSQMDNVATNPNTSHTYYY